MKYHIGTRGGGGVEGFQKTTKKVSRLISMDPKNKIVKWRPFTIYENKRPKFEVLLDEMQKGWSLKIFMEKEFFKNSIQGILGEK